MVGKVLLGWRKIAVVIFLVGVGISMELFTAKGLSTNMLELLKWVGISYLGANAVKGGLQFFGKGHD